MTATVPPTMPTIGHVPPAPPVPVRAPAGTWLLRVGTCEEGPGAVCRLHEQRWHVEVRRDEEGSPRLNLGLEGGRG